MLRAGTDENERSGFSTRGAHVAVQGAQKFVEGFLQRSTLSSDECRALPHLIAARLATSFTRVSRRPFRRLGGGAPYSETPSTRAARRLGWYSYRESLAAQPDMPQQRRDYLLHHALPAATALDVCLEATSLVSNWPTTTPHKDPRR